MTNYAINLIWFTYDAANHKKKKKKKKLAKQRETASVERFTVDDIFCLWDTKKEDIELFIEKANAYHPTHITFFGEISEIETALLDTTVYKEGGKGRGGGVLRTYLHQH